MEFKLENKDILKTWYKDARNKVKENLGIKNPMAVPAISKIVINIGLKEAVSNSKVITLATNVLSEIAGQLPVKALAKKSIAGFKIRDGMPIGTFVTLRGLNMFVFLNKLINLTLPKVRDFQGVPVKLDGRGNYNLGIKDINVFPEAEVSGISELSTGLNITIVTNSGDDKKAKELLASLGMPFIRK